MSFPFNAFDPPRMRQPALAGWVPALRRSRGALRYRCPKTGSFVLLTDPVELARMAAPAAAPVQCPGCGDAHFLALDDHPSTFASRTVV